MAAFEARLARLELIVANHHPRLDKLDQCMEQLDVDELRDGVQGALNEAVEQLRKADDAVRALVESLREEVIMLKGELESCKAQLARGASVPVGVPWFVCEEFQKLRNDVDVLMVAPRVEVPHPETYKGARKAREIENFLYGLELYFDVVGIMGDNAKLQTAPLYLRDYALMWWRRKCDGVLRGGDAITTWERFKTELKAEFEPSNADHEARAKFRHLQHNDGHMKEYVDEFSNLLLEIPNIAPGDALFQFLDGLRPWAKTKVKEKGPEDVSQAMKYARKLLELPRKDSSSQKGRMAAIETEQEL